MAEFKVIETQEEFDARIKERIERAEKKVREEFNGWISPDDQKTLSEKHQSEIKTLKDSHAKDMEKYAGYDDKFKEFTGKIHALETTQLKTRIANEKKLPFDAIEFLTGEDEESISASADKLSKLSGHSAGFTRNTEVTKADADSEWRAFARSLRKD